MEETVENSVSAEMIIRQYQEWLAQVQYQLAVATAKLQELENQGEDQNGTD